MLPFWLIRDFFDGMRRTRGTHLVDHACVSLVDCGLVKESLNPIVESRRYR
jgi:hypothetical protein